MIHHLNQWCLKTQTMLDELFNTISKPIKQAVTAKNCFEALTANEIEELFKSKVTIEFEAGETIIKKGFVASNIMFLEEGLAKLDVVNDNHTSTVGLIQPQSFVGIICTFASHNFEFSATALEKTKISVFDIKIIEKFVQCNGTFACQLIRHTSAITNRLVHHITRFNHKNIEGALSIILDDFSLVYQSSSFTLPVNRIELAKMLGYSKESVINTLSKFNKEGILKVQDKHIEIIDSERLKQISIKG